MRQTGFGCGALPEAESEPMVSLSSPPWVALSLKSEATPAFPDAVAMLACCRCVKSAVKERFLSQRDLKQDY